MVKINKIYTKTGDQGDTGLVGGTRIPKDSDKVEAYGDVDELNAYLGYLRTVSEQQQAPFSEHLAQIQNELFDLGSELATPAGSTWPGMITINEAHAQRLEALIDAYIENIPELKSFVLPGGTILNSLFHVARTICRRAERHVITLSRKEKVSSHAIVYLNRLSDLLFAMARAESFRTNTQEYLWKPGK